jgi:hypothetical protein
MFAGQRLQPLLQTHAFAHHAIEKSGCEHDIQHRIGRSRSQRIAAEGGAMATGRQVFRD